MFGGAGIVMKRTLDENGSPTAYFEYDAWGNQLESNVISGTGSDRFRYQSNWIELKDSGGDLYLSPTRYRSSWYLQILGSGRSIPPSQAVTPYCTHSKGMTEAQRRIRSIRSTRWSGRGTRRRWTGTLLFTVGSPQQVARRRTSEG